MDESSKEYVLASKVRQNLSKLFSQYETLIRKIKSCEIHGNDKFQKKLKESILKPAIDFQQTYILTLTLLPRLSNKNVETDDLDIKEQSELDNTLEFKSFELQNQLIAFKDQRDNLMKMINDANASRRFDDVKLLAQNLDELNQEISLLESRL